MEWFRYSVIVILSGAGIFFLIASMFGTYKFKCALNRMQSAAIGDTLGISLCLLALIVYTGLSFTSLKIFLVIVFLWIASPVASHLTSRLEVTTNDDLEQQCDVTKTDVNKLK